MTAVTISSFLAISANTLHHADCFDVLPHIPDGSVDMVLMDPPYGTTNCKWDTPIDLPRLWQELERITKPNAAIVMFGCQPFASALVMSNPKIFRYEWIWKKNRSTGFLNSKKMPLRSHENIIVFYRKLPIYNPQMLSGKPYSISKNNHVHSTTIYNNIVHISSYSTGSRYPIDVLEFASTRSFHPTEKPVALLEYLIRTYTNEGEFVLDCTMGAGSTCVAAKNIGRQYLGIEKEEEYYLRSKGRIANG